MDPNSRTPVIRTPKNGPPIYRNCHISNSRPPSRLAGSQRLREQAFRESPSGPTKHAWQLEGGYGTGMAADAVGCMSAGVGTLGLELRSTGDIPNRYTCSGA